PTLAEGSVERIAIGCTKLSYKTPRTIKTERIAVTTRRGSVPHDCCDASNVPAKNPCTVEGVPSCCCICAISSVASLSDIPGARLKDTVTEGNNPVWFRASGVVFVFAVDIVNRGTFPLAVTLLVPVG